MRARTRNHASGIYAIQNTVNSLEYIGGTNNIGIRWNDHKYHLNRRTHLNHRLQEAWDEYGSESFKLVVLEETTSLKEREKYFIELRMPEYNLMTVKKGKWVSCIEVIAAQKLDRTLTTDEMIELRKSELIRLESKRRKYFG